MEGIGMAAGEGASKKGLSPDTPKRATLDDLLGKKPARDEFTAPFGAEGVQVSFLFVSIGAKKYDALLTKHPPTAEQRASGATFNTDTFAPTLLSMVCIDPEINAQGWGAVWNGDNWNRGEVSSLFWRAVELCNMRVDINPIDAG
jgi:hypothetical protein